MNIIKSLMIEVMSFCLISCNSGAPKNAISGYSVCKKTHVVNFPDERKIQHEYSLFDGEKYSAILVGYVDYEKSIGLYISNDTRINRTRTFPIDDTMILGLLDNVLTDLKQSYKNHYVTDVHVFMIAAGQSNLSISKKYWKHDKYWIDDMMQQPFFKGLSGVLQKYNYEIGEINYDDFYPIYARDMKHFCFLPDTCKSDAIGIDGYLILKCKRAK